MRAPHELLGLDVILNGGEATVRDRTSAGSNDYVVENATDVCNVLDLRDRIFRFQRFVRSLGGYALLRMTSRANIANKVRA